MSVQERTIVNEEEEEAQKKQKKILGLFPRKAKSPRPNLSGDIARRESSTSTEYDDDDIRQDDAVGLENSGMPTSDSVESLASEDDPSVKAIPKTAGFDFKAISRELGKDIDVNTLRQPVPMPAPPVTTPLERSESAPPPEAESSSSSSRARPSLYLSAEDEIGDITSSMESSFPANAPAEDSWTTRPGSAPLSSPIESPPVAAYNAWNNTPFSMPGRSAPPARPHPPEFLSNPFDNSSVSEAVKWGRGDKDRALAEENPW